MLKTDSPESPFRWLQAVDLPNLAFVVILQTIFRSNYMVELKEEDRLDLKLENDCQVESWVIVVIPDDDPEGMTANLQAPVVINLRNNRGKQIILSDQQYTVKHYIIKEMKERERC